MFVVQLSDLGAQLLDGAVVEQLEAFGPGLIDVL